MRPREIKTNPFEKFVSKAFVESPSGFGKVYKGRLADGALVAVKRLEEEERTPGGDHQFQTEVEMISNGCSQKSTQATGSCFWN
ncbi:hypothetical protein YC2023_067184 [Brassica napus]